MTCSSEPPPINVPSLGMLILSFLTRLSPRMILDDIFLTTATAADVDDAFFFKFSDDFNDALLCGVNILDLHGAHDFHFFLHHVDASAGHVTEELVLLRIRRALQSGGNRLFVDALQDLANGRIVQHRNVFEYEHELTDRVRYFRLAPIDL